MVNNGGWWWLILVHDGWWLWWMVINHGCYWWLILLTDVNDEFRLCSPPADVVKFSEPGAVSKCTTLEGPLTCQAWKNTRRTNIFPHLSCWESGKLQTNHSISQMFSSVLGWVIVLGTRVISARQPTLLKKRARLTNREADASWLKNRFLIVNKVESWLISG